MAQPSNPQEIRLKLEKVLSDRHSLSKSAKLSFRQFDKDNSNSLDVHETKKLLHRLCKNLQLPPVESETFDRVFARYDDGDGELSIDEFGRLYYDLLLRIRDKHFPEKKMLVRRSYFVGHHSLKGGRSITDVFTFEKKLGSGSFGQVHLVREKTTKLLRVCKVINKDKAQIPVEQIQAEIEFMKTLDHPNIIKIFDVYEDYNSIYIIMEQCCGGELMDRVAEGRKEKGEVHEKYVASVMMQMMEALCYFHSKKIAHKDLKPENVMFQDTSPESPLKVIDFGVAELFGGPTDKSAQAAGTALYMAPEVWRRCFGIKCDVWSAGCILYLLLTGALPFTGGSVQQVQRRILTGEPNYKVEARGVSPHAMDLIKAMLQKDPKVRPSALQVLQHPWFKMAPESGATLSHEVLFNLEKYMRGGAVKQALSNLLTHQLNVNGPQVKEIIHLFRTLDKDCDGTLSHDELSNGLQKAGWSQWDINRIEQSLDMDDSGNVNYTEFLTACYSWQEDEINVVWGAFNKMDASGDGKISVAELSRVLSGGEARQGSDKEIRKVVREIDKDGNGYVDWDEFLAYMRG
eukprot:Lankesteria_metandrocarpae@DN4999_c0_g1_i1.p1